MKLERKTFALKLDAPPDDEGRFTGYAAVFGNVDLGNDVIEPGAFTKTLEENPSVPIFWNHNYGKIPIGVSRAMVEDGKGLKIEGELLLSTSAAAREVHGAMKAAAVKGLSIGYRPVKRHFKGHIRHLQEVALGEFSLGNFPMNPLALVDGVKQYSSYDGADCGVSSLLAMIRSGTEFLLAEVAEGDAPDVARMQSILGSLAKLLASEVAELAETGEGAILGPDYPATMYEEMMRDPIEAAVKNLTALLTYEPVEATQDDDGAAPAEEPELVSTLAALTRSLSAT